MHYGFFRSDFIFLASLALALAAPLPGANTVTLTPATLSFGRQVEGTTSAPHTATLKNGLTTSLTITSIAITGNFSQSGGNCPLNGQIAAGASCTIVVVFTPTALGTQNGTLTVTDSASTGSQSSSLTGNGIAPVTVSPATLNFGKLPLGETSAAMNVTLTNQQSVPLNFTGIAASGDFAVAVSNCGTTIGPGKNCTVGVTFSPTATGARTGTLDFNDSATGSPQTVSLSGTGTAAVLLYITVTPPNPFIFVGDAQQFTATGTYSNGPKTISTIVTWTTAPLGIASITNAGLATGLAQGSTTVAASLGAITGSTLLTVSQLFAPTGSLNNARYYHTATMLDTGLVLLAGGIGPIPGGTGALGELASAELYNPGMGAFTYTGSLHQAREQQSATLLNNGSVLMVGGSGGDGELSSAEEYNTTTGLFYVAGPLHTARYEHTATMLPTGSVLIAGGYDGDTVLSSAEIFNPTTGTFTVSINSLNDARFSATATLLPNGLVLIAGGANATGPLASAELYDPVMGTFTPTTHSLNVARSGATATLLNTGQVLIADGYNYSVTGPLTSAELYDPVAGTFNLTGSEASTGWLGTASLLNNGFVLIAGSALNAAIAEIYTPPGVFIPTGALLTPGDLQTATLLANGTVLIAGGHSNSTNEVLANAELYEPATLAPANLVSIAVTPASPPLTVGGSQQFIATGTFSDSTTQQLASVTWTSSSPTAATITNDVTNSGVAYGVAAGMTYISACTGSLCGDTLLTVAAAPKPPR